MRRIFTAVLFAFCFMPLLFTGCGATPATTATTATSSTPATPQVSGNPIDGSWSFQPFVAVPAGSVGLLTVPGALFEGAFATHGNQVTGAGQVQVAANASVMLGCFIPQAVTLHGSFTAARHLSLVSDPMNGGGVLQLEADIPTDPHQASTGTTTLSGPCATTGTVHGVLYAPITGTFNGSVNGIDPATQQGVALGTASATLAETTPDSTGRTVVSGIVKVQLNGCSVQLPVSQARYGGGSVGAFATFSTTAPMAQAALSDTPDGSRVITVITGLGQDCKAVPVTLPLAYSALSSVMLKQ